jgi:uncharacterized protein (DUF1697 family)
MTGMRVAFLRGINVGGHNVKKEVLRDVFLDLDLTDVETFIASGNVIFDGGNRPGRADPDVDARLEARIGAALEARLGWPVPAFVRSPAEIAAMVGVDLVDQLAPGDGETLQLGLLHHRADAGAVQKIEALSTPTDVLRVHGRELYWLCRGPVHKSKTTGARLDRAAGGPVTCRNITTMRRLIEVLRT